MTGISASAAISGGNVGSGGDSPVTARGVVWDTISNPTISLNTKTSDGTGTGGYTSVITQLTANTTYYVRAYATNSSGTVYGNELSFKSNPPIAPVADVYAVGYEGSQAKLWKNGLPTSLTNGSFEAKAYDVYVVNNDVFVVGYEKNATKKVAKVWVNGAATLLTDGSSNAEALSISVSGNDVFVGGYEEDANGYSKPRLWINGVATSTLSPNSSVFRGGVNGVHVVGTEVFLAGWEYTGEPNPKAKVWSNGVGTHLTDGSKSAVAQSVFYAAPNTYIVGNEALKAKLWVNGVGRDLSSGIAAANSIYVSAGDVYVVGNDATAWQRATVWKNGVPTYLTNNSIANANCIFVLGNEVYVGGYERNSSGYNVAKMWKNGIVNILSTTNAHAAVQGIFVK